MSNYEQCPSKRLKTLWLIIVLTQFVSHEIIVSVKNPQHSNNTVYVILMLPYPDPLGRASFAGNYDDGHDISPAAVLAVDQINNCSDILHNYTLKLIMSDGGCSVRGRTIVTYAKDLAHKYGEVPVIGLAGPTCDKAVDIILQLTTENRTPYVSVNWGGADYFVKYPNGFGIIGPDSAFVDAYFKLAQVNRWNRVALLYSTTEAEGAIVLQGLQNVTKNQAYYKDLVSFESEIYDSYFPLEEIKASHIRIIFVVASISLSRDLLCLGFHYNMLFPSYQWVFETKTEVDFHETSVTYDDRNYYCSDEDIYKALSGGLNFHYRFAPKDNLSLTISGHTIEEYKEAYRSYIKPYCESEISCINSFYTPWASVTYDSVWALAVAFNKSVDKYENISSYYRGTKLQKEIAKVVQASMLDVDFQGATGNVKFDKQTHFTNPQFDLLQYNDNGSSEAIMIYSEGELNMLPGTNARFINSSFQTKYGHLPLSASITITVCSFLMLLLTATVQVVNITHRNYKSIKATSHRLNHIVLMGFYLVITGILAFTLQKAVVELGRHMQTFLCHVVPWCISVGLTLILSTACLKTWRLYYIFSSNNAIVQTQTKSVLLKDLTLGGIVTAITFIDIVVLIAWSIGDPLIAVEKMHQNNDGTVTIETQCASDWLVLFALIIGGEKMIILLFSLAFALLTRNVHLKEFETKNIVILVYLLSMMATIGIPLYLVVTIQSSLTVQVVVLNGLLLGVMCVCLFVLYLPPLAPLLKDKYQVILIKLSDTY